MAVDPTSLLSSSSSSSPAPSSAPSSDDDHPAPPKDLILYTASSLGDIRTWRLTSSALVPSSDGQPTAAAQPQAHDTSINKLLFAPSASTPETYDLWTASSDNTAAMFSRPGPTSLTPTTPTTPTTPLTLSLRLPHPDWVRDIAVSGPLGLVATACRDEDVRVWDADDGSLIGVLRGHWDGVEAVCFVGEGEGERGKRRLVSGGLDGTVRVWGVERGGLEGTLVAGGGSEEEGEEVGGEGGKGEGEVKGKEVFTTEEEERELAELMMADDD